MAARLAIAFYATITLAGVVRWAQRRPGPAITPDLGDLRTSATIASSDVNLASRARGAKVRASSWDWFRRHHPLFAIDEEPTPTHLEKWSSAPGDRAPWLEIALPRRAHVSGVRLVFALDPRGAVVRSYTVRALATGVEVAVVRNVDNRLGDITHRLGCDADTIRIDVATASSASPAAPADVARIYEFEVWGRP